MIRRYLEARITESLQHFPAKSVALPLSIFFGVVQ